MKGIADIASEILEAMEMAGLEGDVNAWKELEAFCGIRRDTLEATETPVAHMTLTVALKQLANADRSLVYDMRVGNGRMYRGATVDMACQNFRYVIEKMAD